MIAGVIGGGRAKGRGARAKEESGLMVAAAAAAVGSLPKRWGDRARREKAEEGLLAQPWSICPHFWSSLV